MIATALGIAGIVGCDPYTPYVPFQTPKTVTMKVSHVEPEHARSSADTRNFMIVAPDGTCAVYGGHLFELSARSFQLYGEVKFARENDKSVDIVARGLSSKDCYQFDELNFTPKRKQVR
jgi:hypothetical protein